MRFTSRRSWSSRFALWAAVCALLLKAAVPMLAASAAQMRGVPVAEICTVYGVALPGSSHDEKAHHAHHLGEHPGHSDHSSHSAAAHLSPWDRPPFPGEPAMISLRCAIGCMLAACLVAGAHAHAFLDHAEPRVGATVSAAPAELKLWFTQELEPAFSTVKVLDADGKRVDKGDSRVDGEHREVLRVSLGSLRPGVYTVVWRIVSVDTHVTQGDFAFHVGQ